MAKSLEDYRLEKRRLEIRISNQKSRNARISGEISRLQAAYDKLGRIKRTNADNAEKVREKTKLNKVAGNVQWRGKYKDQFDNAMKDRATPAAKEFFYSIDDMQDEIGRALDKKRGEYNTGSYILNGLNRAWNDVTGIIRNWFN